MRHVYLYSELSRTVMAIVTFLFIWSLLFVQISQADSDPPQRQFHRSSSRPILLQHSPVINNSINIDHSSKVGKEIPEDPPLHNAIRRNDWQSAQKLIAKGADINGLIYHHNSPLLLAIIFGYDDMARHLVENGADVNLPNKSVTIDLKERKWTRKSFQKSFGDVGIFRNLSPYTGGGAEFGKASKVVNTRTITPHSPLGIAIEMKNEELAIFLSKKGAKLNEFEARGSANFLAPNRALANGLYQLAKTMLDQLGPDLRQTTVDNMLPWAIHTPLKNRHDIIQFLSDNDVNFETFDREGMPPLMHASLKGDLETVKLLLDNGAGIDTPTTRTLPNKYPRQEGATTLMVTLSSASPAKKSYEQLIAVVKLLLTRGADVNHQSKNQMAAIHYLATSSTPIDLVKSFYNHGADLNIQDSRGDTLLSRALVNNRTDIAEYLLEKSVDINTVDIVRYIGKNNDRAVNFLLANNFDLNKEKTSRFNSKTPAPLPLFYVCQRGKAEYVIRFITHGADINKEDRYGYTPLFYATKRGYLDIVKILITSGADINHENKEGVSALNFAYTFGQEEIADYLLSQRADKSDTITSPNILGLLKKAGLVDEKIKGIPKKQFEFFKIMLQQELGITNLEELNNPDPRFSSPEKTWELYKKALIDGDLKLASQCHLRRNDKQIEMYKTIGLKKTSEVANNFRPIEKITGDKQRSKYRIRRNIKGTDITFYIYFTNVFGEWKIEQF